MIISNGMDEDARWRWFIPVAVLAVGAVLSAYALIDDDIANIVGRILVIFTVVSALGLFIVVRLSGRR